VLLTLENLADRSQYINARSTFTELLAYGAIPVVNENVRPRPGEGGGRGAWVVALRRALGETSRTRWV
jgi:hypothetical protein